MGNNKGEKTQGQTPAPGYSNLPSRVPEIHGPGPTAFIIFSPSEYLTSLLPVDPS